MVVVTVGIGYVKVTVRLVLGSVMVIAGAALGLVA